MVVRCVVLTSSAFIILVFLLCASVVFVTIPLCLWCCDWSLRFTSKVSNLLPYDVPWSFFSGKQPVWISDPSFLNFRNSLSHLSDVSCRCPSICVIVEYISREVLQGFYWWVTTNSHCDAFIFFPPQEMRICSAIINLFHLIPAAPQTLVKPLLEVVMKTERAMLIEVQSCFCAAWWNCWP